MRPGGDSKERNGSLAVVVGAVLLALLLGKVVFLYAEVPTDSMAPYIGAGRVIVAGRRYGASPAPQRGEVIVFTKAALSAYPVVKRVVGLPGETVMIVRGDVMIDGKLLPEPYVQFAADKNMEAVTVPDGCCFVLGDNRGHSSDSSDWAEKFVAFDDILAKVLFVI